MTWQLHLLDPREPAERRLHRSTLYILLFCALAFAYQVGGSAPEGWGLGMREALWLLALACGGMALCLRRGLAGGERAGAAPPKPAPRKRRGHQFEHEAYVKLARWTLTTNRRFSKADLEMAPLDFRPGQANVSRKPQPSPTQAEHGARKFDPWEAALQEFAARDEERRKR
jgi:hypothetical protein